LNIHECVPITTEFVSGDNTFLVTESESTLMLIGVVYALENPRKVSLEMMEVQSG